MDRSQHPDRIANAPSHDFLNPRVDPSLQDYRHAPGFPALSRLSLHPTKSHALSLGKPAFSPGSPGFACVNSCAGYCPPAVSNGFDGVCGYLARNGGPVMHQAKWVLDFWEPENQGFVFDSPTLDRSASAVVGCGPLATQPNDCTYETLIQRYLTDFCNDAAFWPLLEQYSDDAGRPGGCSLAGQFVEVRGFPDNPLTDGDIHAEAQAALNQFGLCTPDCSTNAGVFVLTPFGVDVCTPRFLAPSSCFFTGGWCAYHDYHDDSIVYASMPDVDTKSGCSSGFRPNGDKFADDEITVLSHEQIEMVTDPTPADGWTYNNDNQHEIGDECVGDYPGVNPDGSDVSLNGHPYIIQAEYSDLNLGCTLDVKGLPVQVTILMTPDTYTGTAASTPVDCQTIPNGSTCQEKNGVPINAFPVLYQEAGDSLPTTTANIACNGNACVATIFATPGTTAIIKADSTGREEWCLSFQCPDQNIAVTCYGTTTCFANALVTVGYPQIPEPVYYTYYDVLLQKVAFSTSDASSPMIPLQYSAPPITAGLSDTLVAGTAHPSNSMSLNIEAVRGSTVTIPFCYPVIMQNNNVACGSATERWSLTPSPFATYYSSCSQLTDSCTWTITAADIVSSSLLYYHQFLVPISFSVADGSAAPSNPTLTTSSFGTANSYPLTATPTPFWLDAGASWYATSVLAGSTSTERWFAQPNNGIVTNAAISVEYFHQYFVTFTVVTVGPSCSNCGGSTLPMSEWVNAGMTITIVAKPSSGYAFAAWFTNQSTIRIAVAGSAATRATVNGPGTISAIFHPTGP